MSPWECIRSDRIFIQQYIQLSNKYKDFLQKEKTEEFKNIAKEYHSQNMMIKARFSSLNQVRCEQSKQENKLMFQKFDFLLKIWKRQQIQNIENIFHPFVFLFAQKFIKIKFKVRIDMTKMSEQINHLYYTEIFKRQEFYIKYLINILLDHLRENRVEKKKIFETFHKQYAYEMTAEQFESFFIRCKQKGIRVKKCVNILWEFLRKQLKIVNLVNNKKEEILKKQEEKIDQYFLKFFFIHSQKMSQNLSPFEVREMIRETDIKPHLIPLTVSEIQIFYEKFLSNQLIMGNVSNVEYMRDLMRNNREFDDVQILNEGLGQNLIKKPKIKKTKLKQIAMDIISLQTVSNKIELSLYSQNTIQVIVSDDKDILNQRLEHLGQKQQILYFFTDQNSLKISLISQDIKLVADFRKQGIYWIQQDKIIQWKNQVYKANDVFKVFQKSDSQEELIFSQEKRICLICFTNKVNTVILPCRHYSLCSQCVQQLVMNQDKCPICRHHMHKIVRLFSKQFYNDQIQKIREKRQE